MGDLKAFIEGFVRRDGLSVFLSTFLIKFFGVILSVAVVRLLPVKEYGYIAFAMSVVGILRAFGGLGSNWSLLRFGPLLPSFYGKFKMFKYSITKGSFYTLGLILIIIFGSFFLPANLENSQPYLIILGIGILFTFLFESLKSYFRIIGRNKIYSKANVVGAFILLILAICLSYFFDGYGYVIAIVLAPLLSFLLYYKHVFFSKPLINQRPAKDFFSYGLFTGLGMIANQATIMLGPILAGYLNASAEDIALFKVATIIPFNLLIIPSMIMTTDFVHFSKNSRDPFVLNQYYFRYLKTISLISVVPFLGLLYFNQEIISLMFGANYEPASTMSFILVVGVFFSFILRTPLGNMLAAVGKANWNIYHTLFWLILLVPGSIFAYEKWGIIGIAGAVSSVFVFSGFISLILFSYYLKTLKQ
jgi:O-antigen/teichoic acid export membrane protein